MDYYPDIVGELSNPNDPICQPGEAQAGWQEGMDERVTEKDRVGSSTMANKTTPREVNPKTKVSGSRLGGCAWIGNLFTQKKDLLLLIYLSKGCDMFVTAA